MRISPEFDSNRGKDEHKKGKYSEAVDSFERAMQLGVKPQACCPELDDSHYKLARGYCKQANWKSAKNQISKALLYNPKSLVYQRVSSILDKNINSTKFSLDKDSYDLRDELQKAFICVQDIGSLIELTNFDNKKYEPLILETHRVGAYRPGYDPESGNSISRAIRRIKSDDHERLTSSFGKLMVAHMLNNTNLADFIDLVVPVPADPRRQQERGYHIVDDLSTVFEEHVALPVCKDVVEKSKGTDSLRGYNKSQREKILDGSFGLVDPDIIRDRNVLIIDEVLTYGTTICEIAKTIKKSEPKEIYALVFLKTERTKN